MSFQSNKLLNLTILRTTCVLLKLSARSSLRPWRHHRSTALWIAARSRDWSRCCVAKDPNFSPFLQPMDSVSSMDMFRPRHWFLFSPFISFYRFRVHLFAILYWRKWSSRLQRWYMTYQIHPSPPLLVDGRQNPLRNQRCWRYIFPPNRFRKNIRKPHSKPSGSGYWPHFADAPSTGATPSSGFGEMNGPQLL